MCDPVELLPSKLLLAEFARATVLSLKWNFVYDHVHSLIQLLIRRQNTFRNDLCSVELQVIVDGQANVTFGGRPHSV